MKRRVAPRVLGLSQERSAQSPHVKNYVAYSYPFGRAVRCYSGSSQKPPEMMDMSSTIRRPNSAPTQAHHREQDL